MSFVYIINTQCWLDSVLRMVVAMSALGILHRAQNVCKWTSHMPSLLASRDAPWQPYLQYSGRK